MKANKSSKLAGTLFENGFLPYYLVQLSGAFNDNLFRSGLLVFLAFQLSQSEASVYNNLAAGLFILPFFIFSSFAGELADHFDNSKLIRYLKLTEILLMCLATAGFMTKSPAFLLLALFLMGTQSAFFGPIKYAIIPRLVSKQQLLPANALVEAGTFISILTGTLTGAILLIGEQGIWQLSIALTSMAMIGYLASRKIRSLPANQVTHKRPIEWINGGWKRLKKILADENLRKPVMAISWFWFLGATYLTQMPVFVKTYLQGEQALVAIVLSCFSVGIASGSLLCNFTNSLSRSKLKGFSLLAMGLFGADLWLATSGILPGSVGEGIIYRCLADFILLGISGGLYIVPLYTQLQKTGKRDKLSRIIAANNILNALYMLFSALVALIILRAGGDVRSILGLVAAGCLLLSVKPLLIRP